MGTADSKPRVSLFATCLVDQIRPSVGMATADLLKRLGCDVTFNPSQTCCGQPAFTSGFRNEARAVAKYTIETFESDDADWIVIPSGSCGAMFRHYNEIFSNDEHWLARADRLVQRTRELSSFIVDVLEVSNVESTFDGRITWHDGCHGLRDLGIREQPRTLLQNVNGAEFIETEKCDACCGFGGVFSINYPGISTAMAEVKLEVVRSAGVDAVVSGDVGCLLQLETTAQHGDYHVQMIHLAELLSGLFAPQ